MTRLLLLAIAAIIAGCLNLPTPPAQITPSYVPRARTSNCEALRDDLPHLARRERDLVVAQNERIRSARTQACLYGFGTGDGIEADELARVRGEMEATRTALRSDACARPEPRKTVKKKKKRKAKPSAPVEVAAPAEPAPDTAPPAPRRRPVTAVEQP